MRASDAQQICPGQDHQLVDLWNDAQPGLGLNNTAACQLPKQGSLPYPVGADGRTPNAACTYEDDVFLNRVLTTIHEHDVSVPFFFFWAAHTIRPCSSPTTTAAKPFAQSEPLLTCMVACADAPLQVPKLWYDRYAHVDDEARRRYLAMVNWLDTAVGNVTDALRAREMYDSTLIVFSSGPQPLKFHSPGMLS